jgi:hypothetical protein
MKHMVWMAVLLAMSVAAARVEAEPAKGTGDLPTAEQMEGFERALKIEAAKAELEHQKQMAALEIEQRALEIEHMKGRRGHKDGGGCAIVFLLILVIHILLTVWVCKDMREQGIGRKLWVPIVLLAGLCGAILYAIVRIADTRPKPAEAEAE